MSTRVAMVLGAGGAFGWVYNAGAVHGVERALGIRAREIDLIVGTSAGAAIGAAVRAGIEPLEVARRVVQPPSEDDRRAMMAEVRDAPKSLLPLSPGLLRHAVTDQRGLVGVAGLLPAGVFPTSWLEAFPGMDRHGSWPGGLWIPAVSAATGEVVVFGRDRSDVPVHRAAQASSAVPGMFRPHTIDGVPYLDGGVASPTHADLAADVDPGLVVVSSPMTRPGRRLTSGHARRCLRAETRTLIERGIPVVVVEPDEPTGALAAGFPRRTGGYAPAIFEHASDLACAGIEARSRAA